MSQPKALHHKNNLADQISKFFDKEKVEQLARETKFVQRESSLMGFDFLLLCMFVHQKNDALSLEDISSELLNDGIEIKKQSIQDRFNPYAVEFMKEMLEEGLKRKLQLRSALEHAIFNRIIIEDSTSFQLPESFQKKYKGSGGCASMSAIKIQYVYDLLSQKIIEIKFTQGNNPDSNLNIFDLKKTIVE